MIQVSCEILLEVTLIKHISFDQTTSTVKWKKISLKGCLYGGEPALQKGLVFFSEILLLW